MRAVEGEEETEIAMVEDSALNKVMMEMIKMATQMAQLQKQNAALRKWKQREVLPRIAGCWICGRKGHVKQDCPSQIWTKP